MYYRYSISISIRGLPMRGRSSNCGGVMSIYVGEVASKEHCVAKDQSHGETQFSGQYWGVVVSRTFPIVIHES